MSDRRKKSSRRGKMTAYIAAGLVHALIIAALVFNFTSEPKQTIEAFDADKVDVVNARTIDESEIKQQQDKLKKAEREKKRREELERKRLEDLKKQAQQEKEEIKKLQDQKELEKQEAAELEKKRIALKKKRELEEEERKKKLAEQKKKDDAEKKRREKLAADKKRKEEQERIKKEQAELEANRRLQEAMAEEQRLMTDRIAKERTATVRSRYAALIKEAVNRKRTIAPDFERWRVATINIKLSPRGEVLDVRIVKSSGSQRYDRDAETAIRKASPLPFPTEEEDAEAHRMFRDVTLNFSMPGAG